MIAMVISVGAMKSQATQDLDLKGSLLLAER
jgi:hypothetical protein